MYVSCCLNNETKNRRSINRKQLASESNKVHVVRGNEGGESDREPRDGVIAEEASGRISEGRVRSEDEICFGASKVINRAGSKISRRYILASSTLAMVTFRLNAADFQMTRSVTQRAYVFLCRTGTIRVCHCISQA